jgi:hypothetical protein
VWPVIVSLDIENVNIYHKKLTVFVLFFLLGNIILSSQNFDKMQFKPNIMVTNGPDKIERVDFDFDWPLF